MAMLINFDAGLVKTKYNIPRANQYLVSRPRLHQKLNTSLNRKLTLVTAPAGYGKTTAVVEWLEKFNLPATWLSIDPEDNNPMLFWHYVCAALDKMASGISIAADYVFTSQELIKANIQINIIIDRLAEVEQDFLFIIDDIHLITNPVILKGLSFLIQYLPPRMHLILISRTMPALELAKFEIKLQMLKISEDDLRFREEEISRFYELRCLRLETGEIQKIESYTEGWAAALVAIAMSVEKNRINDITAGITRCSHGIYQYLKDEVIDAWSFEKKEFALKTSMLDTLCESLCDAVTGESNGLQMLQDFSKRSEFLVPLDNEDTYRYHPLLKNFLYQLLCKSDPAGLLELHARAAAWYQEQGLTFQAIEHYLNGQMYDQALQLIEPQLSDLAGRNDYDTAISWIDRLPESYRENSLDIAGLYADYYASLNNFDLSQKWIDRIKELAVKIDNPHRKLYAKVLISLASANLLMREGKLEELFSIMNGVKENEFSFYKTLEFFEFNTSDIYFYRCPIYKGAILFGERYNDFSDIVRKLRTVIINHAGYTPLAAGEYLYENNRLDEAIPYLLEALEEARSANCPGALVPVMVDLARIKRAGGDLPGAFAVLEECEELLRSINKIHWVYLINAFKTRFYLDRDDTELVDKWLASSKLNIYSEINRINEFAMIVYARVLMAGNRTDDAGLLLVRLLSFAEAEARPHSRVEILNLLAMLAYGKGELSTAVRYMEKSLATGMEEGFVRSFVDEFEPLINVLKQTVSQLRKEADSNASLIAYAKSLIGQIQANMRVISTANSEAAAARIKNLLTAQEIKVLELLYAAHSNEEICSRLNIRLRTVKTHTGNIYSKLGVKNRAQCIKLVRETGILD